MFSKIKLSLITLYRKWFQPSAKRTRDLSKDSLQNEDYDSQFDEDLREFNNRDRYGEFGGISNEFGPPEDRG